MKARLEFGKWTTEYRITEFSLPIQLFMGSG